MNSSTPEFKVAVVGDVRGWGGLQACALDLIAGLNVQGICPTVIWDRDPDPMIIDQVGAKFTFRRVDFSVLPRQLGFVPGPVKYRLRRWGLAATDLGLDHFDFVYNFEPSVRIPHGVANVSYLCGPPLLSVPSQLSGSEQAQSSGLRAWIGRRTVPPLAVDPNANYVALSYWIAGEFERQIGGKIPVVWPPARSRPVTPTAGRSGLLFLSRLLPAKRAEIMIEIARSQPEQRVTIAGAVTDTGDSHYLGRLRASAGSLPNIEIIPNPDDREVIRLLSTHRFFVFPARWEHFGMATVEAIRAGLVPIVHDSGGSRELVPIADLRFDDTIGAIPIVERALNFTSSELEELTSTLQEHTARSSSACFREAMMAPLQLKRSRTPFQGLA